MKHDTSHSAPPTAKHDMSGIAPIAHLIFSAGKQMKRTFEDRAKAQELTLPQWRALSSVVQVSGISQAALANRIETDPMTTSKIVRLLEQRGLVERLADPADSRAKIVRATAKSDALVEGMKDSARQLYATMLVGVSLDEQAELTRLLGKISDNLTGKSRTKDDDK